MRQLERECQSTYEVIPVEDVELRTAFHTFHNNVSDLVKDTGKMRRLWDHTYNIWLKIEREKSDVTEETSIHIKYLLNVGNKVHFLNVMYTEPFDLAPYDFVWIVVFEFGKWMMRWPMGTFVSIHNLISYHDDGLRSSAEVYRHVRKCFDMLYEWIGEGEKTEKSYHGEHGVENWRLREGVKEQYASYLERVKREFTDACVEYHELPNRPLQYETYCAFMETYRMCMNYGNATLSLTFWK